MESQDGLCGKLQDHLIPCHGQAHLALFQLVPSLVQPGLGHFQQIQCQFVWRVKASVTAQAGPAVPWTSIQEDSLQLLPASLDPEHSLADGRPWQCPAEQAKPPGKGCGDTIPPAFRNSQTGGNDGRSSRMALWGWRSHSILGIPCLGLQRRARLRFKGQTPR